MRKHVGHNDHRRVGTNTGRFGLHSWVQILGIWIVIPRISTKCPPPPTGRQPGHWPSIAIPRWTVFGQFWPQICVLPQGPLIGLWVCLPRCFKPKHDLLRVYNLSYEFHQKITRKTQRNMPRHTTSIQCTSYERHGRSRTFDLQNPRNSTHFLYML